MDKKYYWFVYASIQRNGEQTLGEEALEGVHPFQKIKEYQDNIEQSCYYDIVLINYKEISKDEYLLFPKDD